jgi:formylglycine-generating enzyme required for sulfatase activity
MKANYVKLLWAALVLLAPGLICAQGKSAPVIGNASDTRPAPVQSAPVAYTARVRIERLVPEGFVRIPAGTFMMGSPASEEGRDSDEMQHQVTVDGFYMGKYEVTQKEWTEVMGNMMGSNPSYFKGDNLPVENVSWYDAVEYCNRRSLKEGLSPAYRGSGNNITCDFKATGYRLPTEAEWEYACRAGTITRYYSGDREDTLVRVGNVADLAVKEKHPNWTIVNGLDGYAETAPVGRFIPNEWGLYDMHGNVWEWCWDWYGAYSGEAQTDPVGPLIPSFLGTRRIVRGGGWSNGAGLVRSAIRYGHTPSYRNNYLGFRLVRS